MEAQLAQKKGFFNYSREHGESVQEAANREVHKQHLLVAVVVVLPVALLTLLSSISTVMVAVMAAKAMFAVAAAEVVIVSVVVEVRVTAAIISQR